LYFAARQLIDLAVSKYWAFAELSLLLNRPFRKMIASVRIKVSRISQIRHYLEFFNQSLGSDEG
jgi:hypothetical protein